MLPWTISWCEPGPGLAHVANLRNHFWNSSSLLPGEGMSRERMRSRSRSRKFLLAKSHPKRIPRAKHVDPPKKFPRKPALKRDPRSWLRWGDVANAAHTYDIQNHVGTNMYLNNLPLWSPRLVVGRVCAGCMRQPLFDWVSSHVWGLPISQWYQIHVLGVRWCASSSDKSRGNRCQHGALEAWFTNPIWLGSVSATFLDPQSTHGEIDKGPKLIYPIFLYIYLEGRVKKSRKSNCDHATPTQVVLEKGYSHLVSMTQARFWWYAQLSLCFNFPLFSFVVCLYHLLEVDGQTRMKMTTLQTSCWWDSRRGFLGMK